MTNFNEDARYTECLLHILGKLGLRQDMKRLNELLKKGLATIDVVSEEPRVELFICANTQFRIERSSTGCKAVQIEGKELTPKEISRILKVQGFTNQYDLDSGMIVQIRDGSLEIIIYDEDSENELKIYDLIDGCYCADVNDYQRDMRIKPGWNKDCDIMKVWYNYKDYLNGYVMWERGEEDGTL